MITYHLTPMHYTQGVSGSLWQLTFALGQLGNLSFCTQLMDFIGFKCWGHNEETQSQQVHNILQLPFYEFHFLSLTFPILVFAASPHLLMFTLLTLPLLLSRFSVSVHPQYMLWDFAIIVWVHLVKTETTWKWDNTTLNFFFQKSLKKVNTLFGHAVLCARLSEVGTLRK